MANPVHVRNLRKRLIERFRPSIDMSDWEGRPDEEPCFLSRGVAALAVHMETGYSDEEAARSVIDSHTDKGIDAVAVEQRGERHHVTLVQAKWSTKGEAGFGEGDVSAVMRGLDYLLDLETWRFGSKIVRHVAKLEAAMHSPTPSIVIVLALVTGTDLHPNTRGLLEEEIGKRTDAGRKVSYKVVNLRDLNHEILGERGENKVELDVQVHGMGTLSEPFQSYYGSVSTEEVAGWYDRHGRRLTARNIRDALDLSDVNDKIRTTLIKEPEHFWYLSNGITLICDRIRPHGRGTPSPGASRGLRLEGANVINGAQTVSAIHRAMRQKPGRVANGQVMVRIISLEEAPDGFGERITVAANTQNPTEEQDFRSRRSEQFDLRNDFALSLNLHYSIKRGEPAPDPADGCTMQEVALALAAAHSSPEFAAKAKADPSLLWTERYYRPLFDGPPSAHRVWRCVRLLREVSATLRNEQEVLAGRHATAAAHGDLLIAHVLFQTMETSGLDAEGEDAAAIWDARLAEVSGRARKALGWLVEVIDGAYGRNSHISTTVRTTERAERVAEQLRKHVLGGEEPPGAAELRAGPAPGGTDTKTAPAVSVILDAGAIEQGTTLEFHPFFTPELRHLPRWLEENPDRAKAEWRNHRSRPLIWKADGKAYSPSRLVRHMRHEAMGNDQQVQGTLHWHVPGEGSLVDIARELREGPEAEPQESTPLER